MSRSPDQTDLSARRPGIRQQCEASYEGNGHLFQRDHLEGRPQATSSPCLFPGQNRFAGGGPGPRYWLAARSAVGRDHEDESGIGQMCTDVLGPGWALRRTAHLAAVDCIGFALFDFVQDKLQFCQHSTFHFAIQYPDLGRPAGQACRGRLQAADARAGANSQDKPHRMVQVADPVGIVFELSSHSYRLTYSAGAYS